MIDHITFKVSDIEKSKSFYDQVLPTIGYEAKADMSFEGGIRVIGYACQGKIDTWFTNDKPVSGPFHLAWRVQSQKEVDDFYRAAMQAGGRDNGKPGKREMYHPGYYGAFVLDPDGNNIEAVFHEAK